MPTQLEDHENFILDWATAEELLKNWQSRNEDKGYDHWIYFLGLAQKRIKELKY